MKYPLETEKYAHVTFFFNGGREGMFDKEERQLVDSPKGVPTYDHAPAMSCQGVADKVRSHLQDGMRNIVIQHWILDGRNDRIEETPIRHV